MASPFLHTHITRRDIMTIGEYIKATDRKQYNRLMNMFKGNRPKEIPFATVEIKLGDNIENLMAHDSYSRSKGKIKQRRWG